MKLFKKKYKRSAWFEGLLEAEKLFKEGFVPDYKDFSSDRIHLVKPGAFVMIPKSRGEYYRGVFDYIVFQQK